MAGATESGVCDVAARWLFLRTLKASRLLPERQVDEYVAGHPEAGLTRLQALLVDDGLLTPYQLRRIVARDGDGLVLGQYHLQAELGRGGFGVVYLARHALMNRTVALKVIGDQWCRDPLGREFFLREVAGCTRLAHPHIALPYDAGEHDGRLYLALEHVDGPTLDGYLTAGGPLDVRALVAVLGQTAEALRHADDRGVVHRDLKPANILLAPRPAPPGEVPFAVKVIDFGLARFFRRGHEPVGTLLCESGALVGTPAYMAPEQARDVHEADIRSDLYSLGCTAYQAATGLVPFTGRSTPQIVQAVLRGDAVPVAHLRPDLPAWLVGVIRRLMSVDPADRFQTPGELLDSLAARGGPVDPPPAPVPPPEPAVESRVTLWVPADTPPPRSDLAATEIVPPTPPEPVEAFAPWWREWHRQVGLLAAGRPADVNEHEYRALQRTLLRAVRGATAGPAAEHRPGLVAAVEPWVSLKSLTALDRRTLGDVWAGCQRLDATVRRADRRSSILRWW